MTTDSSHKTRTLCLAGMLHAFTHLYQVALLPLYLPIQADLKLPSVGQATLLVTVMMLGYYLPSYPMGVLADRWSRKKLLAFGLALNGLAFVGLSQAPNYPSALACVLLAGFGGSFFHPSATAMIARLFPSNTGKALGLFGSGASIGFFIGPIYTGWRAATSGWRAPVLELGLLGLLGALIFVWLADDVPVTRAAETKAREHPEKMFPTGALWLFFIAASFALSLRDFTGSSMGSLGSLFLQKAQDRDLRETGLILSVVFLASLVSNPLFGHLSDKGRMRWTTLVLCLAAVLVALFPHVPRGWLVPTYVLYGFFFMASYPMVEAALMESVPDSVRGRVFGIFITVGGLVGNTAHWLVGGWVDSLGDRASRVESYYALYGGLALLLVLSLAGLPCLHAVRKREKLAPHVSSDAAQAELRNPQFE